MQYDLSNPEHYQIIKNKVYRSLSRYCLQFLTEDVTQELAISYLEFPNKSQTVWQFVIDFLREKRKHYMLPQGYEYLPIHFQTYLSTNEPSVIDAIQQNQIIYNAKLNDEEYIIWKMVNIEGYYFKEIGKKMGLSDVTIWIRYQKIKSKLRKKWWGYELENEIL